MKILFPHLLFFLLTFTWTECAKILGVFPITARSHYILGSSLMKGLAEAGHDVTIITPYVENKLPKNGSYRQIVLTGLLEGFEKRRKEMNMFEKEDVSTFLFLPFVLNMATNMSEFAINHPSVQEFLKSDEKFDVVIVEEFLNPSHKVFASHFNAPLIVLSTVGAHSWVNTLVGNPTPLSYVPEALLSYSGKMTFCERLINTMFHIYTQALFNFYLYPTSEKIYNEHFPNAPPFYDNLYNISLLLLNSHLSINQPAPYVPNMIDIGGFHIKPSKTLPEDLKKFLDDAKEGVIYFSMGSNLRSSELPPAKRDEFLKTFSKLKMKILWKWEEDVLPGQPENVKLGKWLPQQEILAHPNVKLFITHGGLLSTTETIYHGVPILAIPIAADQKLNAKRSVNDGFGLSLSYQDISEENLMKNIRELLDNPKYSQNAKKRSELFHDRLVKPMDTAVYWVEYVIRHGGAPHLRVAGVDLPWYKYMLVDVIATLSAIVLVSVYIFTKIVKKILSICIKPKAPKLKRH